MLLHVLVMLAFAGSPPSGLKRKSGHEEQEPASRLSASDYVLVGTVKSAAFTNGTQPTEKFLIENAHRSSVSTVHRTEHSHTVIQVTEVISSPGDVKVGDEIAVIGQDRDDWQGDNQLGMDAVFFLRKAARSSRTDLRTFRFGMTGENFIVVKYPANQDSRCEYVAVTDYNCVVTEAVHAPSDEPLDTFAPGEMVCGAMPDESLCDAVHWDDFLAAIRSDAATHSPHDNLEAN